MHAPYDFETWRGFWDVVEGMEGLDHRGSLGVWVEFWGEEQGLVRECGWVRCMVEAGERRKKGAGVGRVDVGVEWRVGPWRSERRGEVEEVVSEAWARRESENVRAEIGVEESQ